MYNSDDLISSFLILFPLFLVLTDCSVYLFPVLNEIRHSFLIADLREIFLCRIMLAVH